MSWLDRVGDGADELRQGRQLQRQGRSAEALRVLDAVVAATPDPVARADALVQRLGALLNLGRTVEYPGATDAAFEAVREIGDPYLRGHLHAFAALAAHIRGRFNRGVKYLVRSARALSAVPDGGAETAWAWHDLALAYSYLGFHGAALTTIERSRRLGAASGIAGEELAAPGIRLRNAVELDHHGDADGCLRVLRELATELDRFVDTGRHVRLRPGSRTVYGYALSRRAALVAAGAAGEANAVPEVAGLLADGGDSVRARELRQLAEVCLSIAAGRPGEALGRLTGMTPSAEALGPAESERLRSLAHAAAGNHAAAHAADRHAFRLAVRHFDPMRNGYVDGVAARIDQDANAPATRPDEALVDPLTGLPNRRQLERHVTALLASGGHAAIGVCNLVDFSAVNLRHGRRCGDLVLQRVAGVLNRVMRRGDFVARFGGDVFVVVLPGASHGQAAEVSRRINAAIVAEDWTTVGAGIAISVAIGWADLRPTGPGLGAALASAANRAAARPAADAPSAG